MRLNESNLHPPDQCHRYQTFVPLPFSHKRHFGIKLRQIRYKGLTNKPFLSSESLASMADVTILNEGQLTRVNLNRIRKMKSLFLNADFLETFLEKFYEDLPEFVLFTGHSDRNFIAIPELLAKVRKWYCQNSSISDNQRIFTLPIGIENLSLGRAGRKQYFTNSKARHINRVLVTPMSPTNPIRKKTVLECMSMSNFDVFTQGLEERDYFAKMHDYQFNLCLEGNGYDTHRLWETLYLGRFPILLHSRWAESLTYLNLPIMIVNSIAEITEERLLAFWRKNEMFKPEEHSALWCDFWRDLIES